MEKLNPPAGTHSLEGDEILRQAALRLIDEKDAAIRLRLHRRTHSGQQTDREERR
jgi:hypothetical protein